MIIGVDSKIGFSFIVGPSLLQNAFHIFQAGGMLPAQASPSDAIACSRAFAAQLAKLSELPGSITSRFPLIHAQLKDQLEAFPASLDRSFEEFRQHPTVAGVSLYFNLLAGLLDEETGNKSSPKKHS
jgi:hypothetical protein